MASMQNNMITVKSCYPLEPLEKNAWRFIGFILGKQIIFLDGGTVGFAIGFGEKIVISPQKRNILFSSKLMMRNLSFNNNLIKVYSEHEVKIEKINHEYYISDDFWTPLLQLLKLEEEKSSLKRDRYGLFLGKSTRRAEQSSENLTIDLFYEAIRFLSLIFDIKISLFGDDSPYSVALSFDVDGFYPNQPKKVLDFLGKWDINKPTFMVMAPELNELTIYDSIYDLEDPSLHDLWNSEVEIGLHSSYIAHDNFEFLVNQKKRLEKISGRGIKGHRSHYYRFAFPRSWGNQMKAGFTYDASLGYPDLPGTRNGTNLPVNYPDPGGDDRSYWAITTTFLDQHFFNEMSSFNWNQKGKEKINNLLDRMKENNGIVTLDWHIHCIDHASFPFHYEVLAYILDKASSDGARICGIGNIIDLADKEWKNLKVHETPLLFSDGIEKIVVPRNEIDSYIDVFSKQNLGATSIDAAIHSFLLSLPVEAENILDIGCGPGTMSNRIPPFYKVICMDLDEQILKPIARPKYLGDITNIPLKDKSMDLILACDVLEHLNDEELDKAKNELERVSRKYIYIQTPLEENLDAAKLKCPHCSYKWHVNYHKQSFSLKRIMKLLSKDWKVKIVNFTGDVSYIKTPEEYHQIQHELGFNNLLYSKFQCPQCEGSVERDISQEEDKIFNNISNLNVQTISMKDLFPHYSEIGVLFEFLGDSIPESSPIIRTKSGIKKQLVKPDILNYWKIDFSKPFRESKSYSTFETLPVVVPVEIAIIKENNGINLYKSELSNNPSLSFGFPLNIYTNDILEINGQSEEEVKLNILGYSTTKQEFEINRVLVKGEFNISVIIPSYLNASRAFFRIVWSGANHLKIKDIQVVNKQEIYNNNKIKWYEGLDEFSHIEMGIGGVLYRWIVPYDKKLIFPDDFSNWIKQKFNKKENVFDLREKILTYWKELFHNQSEMEKMVYQERNNVRERDNISNSTYLESMALHNNAIELMEEKFILESQKSNDKETRYQNSLHALELMEEKFILELQKSNDKELKYENSISALQRKNFDLYSVIELFEQINLTEHSSLSTNDSVQVRVKSYIKRGIKKIFSFLKMMLKKFPILLKLAKLLGLKRIYNKLKIRGWVD